MAGSLRINGGTLQIPSGLIVNEDINSAAGIDADKMQHLHACGTNFALAIGGTPATREEIVFIATTAGVIRLFSATLNDTGTNTDIDFDLKKNGTTCLSSAVTIVHGDADKSIHDGTLSVTTFAADDILSIAMTVNSSTGAQGPYAQVVIQETAA